MTYFTKDAFLAIGWSLPKKKTVLWVLEGNKFLCYDLQIAGSSVEAVD